MSENAKPQVFDRNKVLANLDGDFDLLKDICKEFLGGAGKLLTAVKEAVDASNADAITASAKGLKGAVANFHADKTYALAQQLEDLGKSDDLSSAPTLYSQLELEMNSLVDAVKEESERPDTPAKTAVQEKMGIFNLIDELKISMETTYTIRKALEKKLNDLQNRMLEREGDIAALQESVDDIKQTLEKRQAFASKDAETQKASAAEISGLAGRIDNLEEYVKLVEEASKKQYENINAEIGEVRNVLYGLLKRLKRFAMNYSMDLWDGEDMSIKKLEKEGESKDEDAQKPAASPSQKQTGESRHSMSAFSLNRFKK